MIGAVFIITFAVVVLIHEMEWVIRPVYAIAKRIVIKRQMTDENELKKTNDEGKIIILKYYFILIFVSVGAILGLFTDQWLIFLIFLITDTLICSYIAVLTTDIEDIKIHKVLIHWVNSLFNCCLMIFLLLSKFYFQFDYFKILKQLI